MKPAILVIHSVIRDWIALSAGDLETLRSAAVDVHLADSSMLLRAELAAAARSL